MPAEKIYRCNPHLPFIKEGVRGNVYINGQYCNDNDPDRLPRSKLMQWMVTANPQRREKLSDRWAPEVQFSGFLKETEDHITWLGHSSFFMQLNGRRILTDPVLFDIAPMLRRRHRLPCMPSDLRGIDYILLSHGHRDHLDIPSLSLLARQNPGAVILCPLGFEKMMRNIGFHHVQEAAWWQQYTMPKNIEVTFLPARHWNRRWLWDYNTTLWGSFLIGAGKKQVYFAGDSAYGSHYKDMYNTLGSMDICLMPVGAYKPRYVMEWAHMSPEEAVQAFNDLGGDLFLPKHYGTFDLSDEPASEPVQLCREIFSKNNRLHQLKMPAAGEIVGVG